MTLAFGFESRNPSAQRPSLNADSPLIARSEIPNPSTPQRALSAMASSAILHAFYLMPELSQLAIRGTALLITQGYSVPIPADTPSTVSALQSTPTFRRIRSRIADISFSRPGAASTAMSMRGLQRRQSVPSPLLPD